MESQEQGYSYGNDVQQNWVPSKDQIKERLKSKEPSEMQKRKEYARNRKQAIKEILQENVERTVKVKNKEVLDKFNDGVNGR